MKYLLVYFVAWLGMMTFVVLALLPFLTRINIPEVYEQTAGTVDWEIVASSLSVRPNEYLTLQIISHSQGPVASVSAVLELPMNNWELATVYWQPKTTQSQVAVADNKKAIKLVSALEQPKTGSVVWAEVILKAVRPGMNQIQINCALTKWQTDDSTTNDCGQTQPAPIVVKSLSAAQAKQTSACTQIPPQSVRAVTVQLGANPDEVVVHWDAEASTEAVTVEYGTQVDAFPYAIPLIEDQDQVVVSGLEPGQTYYWTIRAIQGCASSSKSPAVSITLPPLSIAGLTQSPKPSPSLPATLLPAPPQSIAALRPILAKDNLWVLILAFWGTVGMTGLLIKQIVQKPKENILPHLKHLSIWE